MSIPHVTIILSIKQLQYIQDALEVNRCADVYIPEHNEDGVEIGGELIEDISAVLADNSTGEYVNNIYSFIPNLVADPIYNNWVNGDV